MDAAVGLGALILFHAHAGVRLALRAMVMLVVPVVALIGTRPDPSATIAALARSVAASPIPSGVFAGILVLALGMAAWAAPRLVEGTSGWMGHLPVSEASRRRAAAAGLVLVQAPLLIALTILLAGVLAFGIDVPLAKAAGFALLAPGAAFAALPARRRILSAPAGAAAAAFSLSGEWSGVAISAILIAAADLVAGPLPEARRAAAMRPGFALPFSARIAVRATGPWIAGAGILALLALALTSLFISNNELAGAKAAAAARLGGFFSMSLMVASIAEALAVRLPPWPWSRSLPWGAADRVRAEGLFLGSIALMVVAIAGRLDALSTIILAACVPALVFRASARIRSSAGSKPGPAVWILVEGFAAAGIVGLLPWSALICLALAPAAFRAAVREDRKLKVTAWKEKHHASAGDTWSWGGA